MCGISGLVSAKSGASKIAPTLLDMISQLHHRGPDASGTWVSKDGRVGLAHARLSIIDLSEAGAQPMKSPSGRWVISFNGEIYNHKKLSAELKQEGCTFRGRSDTEVLAAAIEIWGFKKAIESLTGMFAIAAYDNIQSKLYLVRDRIGEKPLYFGKVGGDFVFGSELKSLKNHPEWNTNIDTSALQSYFRFGYVPTPKSIFENIQKIIPGNYLVLDTSTIELGPPKFFNYWNINEYEKEHFTEDEVMTEVEARLITSIRGQMESDVPIGVFLSGGIDSSLVAAIMQSLNDSPIRTFTIGFKEQQFNEAIHAKAIADHLGTNHREFIIGPEDALAVVEKLSQIYDEPFSDSSQIPTYLVSKYASEHVKVCLSGDAGDELFCGYNRYIYAEQTWTALSFIPGFLKKPIAAFINSVPIIAVESCISLLAHIYKPLRSVKKGQSEKKIQKIITGMNANSFSEYYYSLVSCWQDDECIVLDEQRKPSRRELRIDVDDYADKLDGMMQRDMQTYLPDDNLVKVDRASMASSLEVRLPLLDHRLVETALKIPSNQKYQYGKAKWPLRNILYKYVPPALIERPKMGFSVPIDQWLRGPLKKWAEQLINYEKLVAEGYLDAAKIGEVWLEHQSNKFDHSAKLWSVLMFEAWLEKNI